jgi:hypothetical protein
MLTQFSDLENLDFEQKRDLLKLLTAVLDAARNRVAATHDAGGKSEKLRSITDSIGLEALYYEVTAMRLALERDHNILVVDLIEPVLRYCNNS